MTRTPFHIFGLSHWVALAMSVLLGWWFIRIMRHGPNHMKFCVRLGLALVLFLAVMADPPITFLRFAAEDPALARRLLHETAWPFYLCDWAAIICGIALLKKSQRLAEIGWCWGLGGTLQGLVYPTSLSYDWPNPDWFAFFAEHGGVPVAGAVLVFGLGLRPQPGVVWRAWRWLLLYFGVAALVNLLVIKIGGYPTANYGFVCSSDYSPFALLGNWPTYIAAEIFILWLIFLALTWPFCGRKAWQWKRPARPAPQAAPATPV